MADIADQNAAQRSATPRPTRSVRQPMVNASPATNRTVLLLFMISMCIPYIFYIGSLLMTPYRLFMLIMIVPLTFNWLSGLSGRFRMTDLWVVLFLVWHAIAMLVVHGASHIEFIGITTIETFGPYVLARRHIRSWEDLAYIGRCMFWILLILIPAAVIESNTEFRIFYEFFIMIGDSYGWLDNDPRMGMFRAQTVFEHPILYGMFAACAFSFLYYLPRGDQKSAGMRRAWVSPAAAFFSFSTGAYLVIIGQVGLMLWDWIMRSLKGRWMMLIGLVVAAYVTVDLLSNRTPFEVFITYLTLNPGTGYWRVSIFIHGMENVWAYPIFGNGLNDWFRPWWMHSASVDNLFLVLAMRSGIPGFLFFALLYVSAILSTSRPKLDSYRDQKARYTVVFVLVAVAVGVCTVHLWGATFAFLMFLFGAGHWVHEAAARGPEDKDGDGAELAEVEERRGPVYSRYAPRPASATQRSR